MFGHEMLWRSLRRVAGVGALTLLSMLAACGGGGGGGSGAPSGSTSGEVVIGLTDAEGDFVSYSVDVVSLQLTKANGAVVETLPNKVRVDFAQYTALTEFITAATVPSGAYVGAKLRLDYTSAEIKVEDANGNAVAATAADGNGAPLGAVEMTVKFDNRNNLVVAPGIPAHITLDFDLAATNRVDLTTQPATVTVEPVLIADVMPQAGKPHRVRGPLLSVDSAAGSFRVGIRPFYVLRGEHGRLTVVTDASTQFEINGVAYQGGAGLTQLAALPTLTATLAIGELNAAQHKFVATEVHAGSSVPYGTSDVVSGSVVARAGDVLSVKGASILRTDGVATFNDEFTVNVSANSKIVRAGQAITGNPATLAELSVGSFITAFGSLNGNVLDASGSDDLVRLGYSTVTGTAISVAPGLLHVNVQTINRRRASLFNFAGTGSNAANDTQAADYEVNSGALTLSGVAAGTPLRLRGFVQPFGQAPEDFDAQTLVNVSAVPANLVVDWQPSTAAPFNAINSLALELNLSGAPRLHHVFRGGAAIDLTQPPYQSAAPSLKPESGGKGLFSIAEHGTIQVYTTFDSYASALQTQLNSGKRADRLAGQGSFDDAGVALTTRSIATRLR